MPMCIWTLTKEAATCRATSARVVVQKESSDCAKTGNAGLFQEFDALCRDRQPAVFGGAPMPVTDFRGRWVFASSVRFGARRASIPSVMETLSSADLKTLRAVLLAERASLLGVYASKLDVLAHSDCVSAEDQAPPRPGPVRCALLPQSRIGEAQGDRISPGTPPRGGIRGLPDMRGAY